MEEKVLSGKKHGMLTLLCCVAVMLLAVAGVAYGAITAGEDEISPLLIVSVVVLCVAWIPLAGLRILKPQEALVLTLFGKYVGTLKGEGFYAVNPFCSSINPAANTKLNQSGDVKTVKSVFGVKSDDETVSVGVTDKRISLKIMTLSNNRQKINDCLGNPVEIGIAVTWKIVDTAKAVFNVDNYKEYLSLQCDSALRNIVRIYPYDVSPNVDTTGDGLADEGSLRRTH